MYDALKQKAVSGKTNLLMNALWNVDIPLPEGVEAGNENQKEEKKSM